MRHRLPKSLEVLLKLATVFFVAGGGFAHSWKTGWPGFVIMAQSSTATLSGTVADEAGAVINGARITVLNLSTALQRHATTNSDGAYVIPLLPPGRYNVTVQHDGFATVEIRNVTLSVNDALSLRVKLKVGEIGETVTIVDEYSELQHTAAAGTVII